MTLRHTTTDSWDGGNSLQFQFQQTHDSAPWLYSEEIVPPLPQLMPQLVIEQDSSDEQLDFPGEEAKGVRIVIKNKPFRVWLRLVFPETTCAFGSRMKQTMPPPSFQQYRLSVKLVYNEQEVDTVADQSNYCIAVQSTAVTGTTAATSSNFGTNPCVPFSPATALLADNSAVEARREQKRHHYCCLNYHLYHCAAAATTTSNTPSVRSAHKYFREREVECVKIKPMEFTAYIAHEQTDLAEVTIRFHALSNHHDNMLFRLRFTAVPIPALSASMPTASLPTICATLLSDPIRVISKSKHMPSCKVRKDRKALRKSNESPKAAVITESLNEIEKGEEEFCQTLHKMHSSSKHAITKQNKNSANYNINRGKPLHD